ncbi:MAG: general stress protein [Microbacteriaceae bacterium]
MTNPGLFGRRPPAIPTLPRGEVLGTYDTYPEAQKVVDRLAKAEFEVARVSIVGSDLKTVERVTGRLTYGRAALAGGLSGLWFGLFLGLLFVLFAPESGLSILLAALLIGAAFGMLFGLITYAVQRRSHDFTSMTQVLASRYDVLVAPELLAKAQDALQRSPSE